MSTFVQAAAAAFAALLFAAVLGKIDSWLAWQDTLSAVSPLPRPVTSRLLYGIPLGEGLTGVLIIISPEFGLLTAAFLFGSLAVAVWMLSAEHKGQSCSCFGALMPSEISPRLAGRNAILAALAGGGAYAAMHVGVGALPLGVLVITLVAGLLLSIVLQFHRFTRLRPRGARHG